MKTSPLLLTLLAWASAYCMEAAELRGTVLDPSHRPIAGATVAVFTRVGIIAQGLTGASGEFELSIPDAQRADSGTELRVTAPGFTTRTVSAGDHSIELTIAPQTDSIRVVGSSIDTPVSLQGSSVTVISSAEIRDRNEGLVTDLLRQVPGVVLAQSGSRGTVASMFVRGGDSKYNLVELNGMPISGFYFGGLFDFAHLPSDAISEIEVARGPQSAVNGSYAIASVVNFVTRSPADGYALDVLAEGGTHAEQRFAVSGSGTLRGWGIAGSATHIGDNGPVMNSDYTNQGALLSASHRWGTQNLYAFGDYDWNEVGEPGAYGSNPKGYFTGIDRISRSRNYTSTYGAHYQADISPRFRQDVFAGFYLNNNGYRSPYGTSFNKDLRLSGEARETFSVSRFWTMSGGFSFAREEDRNTYVTSRSGGVLLRRDDEGIYWENRFQVGQRLFLNAGVRGELFQMPFVPGDAYGSRPDFAARNYSQVSPKVSGVYLLPVGTRVHASFGTGIRPPGGSDLAFTNNPALKPERTRSYDVGVEERLWRDTLSLDATWFHNRYRDLIVNLGGSLSKLSQYSTGNLNNAKSQGVETSAQWRPARWVSVRGSYTWLQAEVLALEGTGVAQTYYTPGQALPRRPKHSGSMLVTARYRRLDANVAGYFRGDVLDVEPNFGASGGFYRNSGYQNLSVNLNLRVTSKLGGYVNLRNAFNQRYEEIYGFPAPLLNVVAGLKWSLGRAN